MRNCKTFFPYLFNQHEISGLKLRSQNVRKLVLPFFFTLPQGNIYFFGRTFKTKRMAHGHQTEVGWINKQLKKFKYESPTQLSVSQVLKIKVKYGSFSHFRKKTTKVQYVDTLI